mmetsp:Transcript_50452/g.130211  ORF Transcript_50452/g.130211 Transcript_50452/m.130211 type:complete len:231 (+) Transcript_50452:440-1132(+)
MPIPSAHFLYPAVDTITTNASVVLLAFRTRMPPATTREVSACLNKSYPTGNRNFGKRATSPTVRKASTAPSGTIAALGPELPCKKCRTRLQTNAPSEGCSETTSRAGSGPNVSGVASTAATGEECRTERRQRPGVSLRLARTKTPKIRWPTPSFTTRSHPEDIGLRSGLNDVDGGRKISNIIPSIPLSCGRSPSSENRGGRGWTLAAHSRAARSLLCTTSPAARGSRPTT